MEETILSYLLESHKRSVLTAKTSLFFQLGLSTNSNTGTKYQVWLYKIILVCLYNTQIQLYGVSL